MTNDKHIIPEDTSSTLLARKTVCCGGYHQTIAGALLKSKEWEAWYKHACDNMLYDVMETCTIDAMSDDHFRDFIKFIKTL